MEGHQPTPSFIFIDLDRSLFKDERAHSLALNKTLKNLTEKLGGAHPTVLWSGNGYHIYQPIDAIILEQYDIFSEFEHPSRTFLKFAEQYFSNSKSDPAHNLTFKSCMIRIPGSHNSRAVRIEKRGHSGFFNRGQNYTKVEWFTAQD